MDQQEGSFDERSESKAFDSLQTYEGLQITIHSKKLLNFYSKTVFDFFFLKASAKITLKTFLEDNVQLVAEKIIYLSEILAAMTIQSSHNFQFVQLLLMFNLMTIKIWVLKIILYQKEKK